MSDMCESSRECSRYREAAKMKSKWDQVGEAFLDLACLDGGPKKIYKPVIQLEYYEHDGCVGIRVGRCKGMDDVVADVGESESCAYEYVQPEDHESMQLIHIADAILKAIARAKAEATK